MEIKPTRSELMKLKKKIKLAKSGHNLLKKKRDGLIIEFFEILKQAKTVRKELTDAYKKARHNVDVASAVEGVFPLKTAAMTVSPYTPIELSSKNIMGVVVPKIKTEKNTKTQVYSYIRGSIAIDEAIATYKQVLEKAVTAAEVETAMLKLLQEIEKTKRRVNALEFSLIPKMQKEASFVTLRLEEMERENIFRLKRIKNRLKSA
ncbi:MAG: V-type ATP synthase subunit D [Nanoarchaeota archaeon]|nr:V-type ATP synthase subunit D [Nanoarchaeota archaeon]MBU4300834.1 V-type ATP synthase subunit D [Nanoarchaeota archaeon]MBU4452021.1 V-type ATP synthase subunit D [Nanoarchaeota archaeon]MCG2724466.1 V-type ATP synthase subunit D [archaeon]